MQKNFFTSARKFVQKYAKFYNNGILSKWDKKWIILILNRKHYKGYLILGGALIEV